MNEHVNEVFQPLLDSLLPAQDDENAQEASIRKFPTLAAAEAWANRPIIPPGMQRDIDNGDY
jgi:hypothetical protein